jgi:cytochrome c-type biogenesis protein CcmH/NrfG
MFRSLQPFCLVVVGAVLGACTGTSGSPPAKPDPDAPLMTRGIDTMYKSGDPVAAEAIFRQVLEHNPTHYGAHYQLAVALDRGGRPTEARPAWDDVLKNAMAIGDTATAQTARARLAAPDTASQEEMMILGVDLLRHKNNPAAAADVFRKVLQRTPTHYGATYQLASALDLSGRPAEAKALWQKMLGMATAIRDTTTARTARERLAAIR